MQERRPSHRRSGEKVREAGKRAALFALITLLGFVATASPLTPEQAVKLRRISELEFSPGGALACTVSELHGQSPESHIWVLDAGASNAELRQATFSAKSERSPHYAPDGRSLAFLSNRGGSMQVYVMPLAGGEAAAVTDSARGVESFRWSPDGTRIAYLARQPKSEADEKREREHDDAHVADREDARTRLWLLDLGTKKTRQVTSSPWSLSDLAWLDGTHVAVVGTKRAEADAWTDAIYSVNIADGGIAPLVQPVQPFDGLTLSPRRTRLAFAGTRTGGPIPHDLFVQRLGAGGEAAPRDVTVALDRNVLNTRWQDEATAVIRVNDGFLYRLYRVGPEGAPSLIDLPYSIRAFDVRPDGTIAFVAVGFNRLPELFLRTPGGATRQVSHVQTGPTLPLTDARLFHVASFDGRKIEYALLEPSSEQPAKSERAVNEEQPAANKDQPADTIDRRTATSEPRTATSKGRPLILLVHGGPASAFSSDYFWFNAWGQLLVSRGYAVLMVNPRGSAGYGEEFLKANRADWGGGDFRDLMAAVDAVIAAGHVDRQRLGIAGWSYGGEMAVWATTQSERFKAAVVGGVVFDQAAEFEMEDSSAGDEWYFGTPWENPEVFTRNSPATFVRYAQTPTLILHGEDDPTNPPGQAAALYRALKHFHVEAQLVTYPREQHLPREEMHQIDIMKRMLAWFDGHL